MYYLKEETQTNNDIPSTFYWKVIDDIAYDATADTELGKRRNKIELTAWVSCLTSWKKKRSSTKLSFTILTDEEYFLERL